MAGEIEKIKEKINIAEFLKNYVDLRPAGRNFKAVCPFHQEKTPSFVVSPERKMWRCFGACGEGGDVFKFLMKFENLEFHEALKILAEKAGIPLQRLNPREQKEFGVLYDINETAKDFFRDELAKNEAARSYLLERGLNEETVQDFELGFARGGESLVLHLLRAGYEIGDVARAGLAYKNSYNLYRDKFDYRIMFPIYNAMGKIVAFTGRIMPDFKGDAPKYMNSPETPVFNKSKILYGFHRSKNEIAKSRTVFVVEGQMDFLMAWQAGIKNTIAVSGTGVTDHHLERLRRVADTVIMSFDNDEAGLRAMERGTELFGGFDFFTKVIDLGDFKDPADACKDNPAFLVKAVGEARSAFQRLFEVHFNNLSSDDIPGRKRLISHFLQMLRKLKSATEQQIWLKHLAGLSGVNETALTREFEKADGLAKMTQVNAPETTYGTQREEKGSRIDMIAKRLATLALSHQKLLAEFQAAGDIVPDRYRGVVEGRLDDKDTEFVLRASLEESSVNPAAAEDEFHDLLRHLKMEVLRKKQAVLKQAIGRAQLQGDEEASSAALTEFYTIAKQLEGLKK